MIKIKNVLVFTLVILTASPLFLGLNFLNEIYSEHNRSTFENHLAAMSLLAKKRVQTSLERIQDNSALITSRTYFRESLKQWNQTRSDEHLDALSRIIKDAQEGLNLLQELSVFDHRGEFVTSSSSEAKSELLNVQNLMQGTFKTRLMGETLSIVQLAPLLMDNDIIGYIRVVYEMDLIEDLVQDRFGLGDTGQWLVAIPQENNDLIFISSLKNKNDITIHKPQLKDRTDIPIYQALSGHEIIMSQTFDYRGQPVMASTRYIKELNAGLVAKIDEAEINQFATQSILLIYTVEFVIVTLAIVVGVLLSIYISDPVTKLLSQASAVTKGDIKVLPVSGGWKEIRDLSTQFNQMINSLQQFKYDLSREVETKNFQIKAMKEQLETSSVEDLLTGVMNRQFFMERFSEEVSRAKRFNFYLSIIYIDIDDFRSINEIRGMAKGDEVLIRLANYLKTALREYDLIARIGGGKFCLVLSECSEQASMSFLQRVRKDIAAIKFSCEKGHFKITCSIGLALLDEKTKLPTSLLQSAETAMQQARALGGNQVVVAVKSEVIA